jgi:hypothetical protein
MNHHLAFFEKSGNTDPEALGEEILERYFVTKWRVAAAEMNGCASVGALKIVNFSRRKYAYGSRAGKLDP